MFYQFGDNLKEIEYEEINPLIFTVGVITSDELQNIGALLGLDSDLMESSSENNASFRTCAEVRENYTYLELNILTENDIIDRMSLFIKENLLLVVDIKDQDNSTVNSFLKTIKKFPASSICKEKVICYYIDTLLSNSNIVTRDLLARLGQMEESIVAGQVKEEFSKELLVVKKEILRYYTHYGLLLEIAEVLEDNDNDILNKDNLFYISNLIGKITRRRDDINTINSMADHIQDAHASLLDHQMNATMKLFTVLTTIFFPLTIIVGWYGMNFNNMPLINWKYGYYCVIIFSFLVVGFLIYFGKKKKWF